MIEDRLKSVEAVEENISKKWQWMTPRVGGAQLLCSAEFCVSFGDVFGTASLHMLGEKEVGEVGCDPGSCRRSYGSQTGKFVSY